MAGRALLGSGMAGRALLGSSMAGRALLGSGMAARATRSSTRARRAGARPLVAVLALAMAAASPASAAAAIVWLTPLRGGVAALAEDGQVTFFPDRPDRTPVPLASNVQGDALLACDGHLYAVAAGGELGILGGGGEGPRVSLHSRPACLPSGRVVALDENAAAVLLLAPDLSVLARAELEVLPDDDPVVLDDGSVAVLAAPTQRYRHGVLGDEVEASAVAVLDPDDLHTIGRMTLEPPWVIEQRRVLPFAAAGEHGMLITVAAAGRGAGVAAVAQVGGALAEVARSPALPAPEAWLNLFAADGPVAYAVATPHGGGRLERFRWSAAGGAPSGRLARSRFDLAVTNHVLGSRNLDLALLLPAPPGASGVDVLVLPTRDRRSLRLVRCAEAGCAQVRTLALRAPLSSNLAALRRDGALWLYAGGADGAVARLDVGDAAWFPTADAGRTPATPSTGGPR